MWCCGCFAAGHLACRKDFVPASAWTLLFLGSASIRVSSLLRLRFMFLSFRPIGCASQKKYCASKKNTDTQTEQQIKGIRRFRTASGNKHKNKRKNRNIKSKSVCPETMKEPKQDQCKIRNQKKNKQKRKCDEMLVRCFFFNLKCACKRRPRGSTFQQQLRTKSASPTLERPNSGCNLCRTDVRGEGLSLT